MMEDELNTWENITASKQSWNHVRYCHKSRKWIMRPVFYVKYRGSKRFQRLPIKEAINLIGNIFPLTDDLKKWMETGKN